MAQIPQRARVSLERRISFERDRDPLRLALLLLDLRTSRDPYVTLRRDAWVELVCRLMAGSVSPFDGLVPGVHGGVLLPALLSLSGWRVSLDVPLTDLVLAHDGITDAGGAEVVSTMMRDVLETSSS